MQPGSALRTDFPLKFRVYLSLVRCYCGQYSMDSPRNHYDCSPSGAVAHRKTDRKVTGQPSRAQSGPTPEKRDYR